MLLQKKRTVNLTTVVILNGIYNSTGADAMYRLK